MTDRPAFPRIPRVALAILLAVLAGYGAFSTPGLVARWGASPAGWLVLAAWVTAAAAAIPLSRGAPSRGGLLALAATALGFRLLVLAAFHLRVPAGDAHSYLDLARHLLAGQGLSIFEPYIGSTLYAFYPPVYPMGLAAWQALAGASAVALVALNLTLDIAACVLLRRLATAIGRPDAGRAAAWLYLIWPSVLLSAPLAQKEGLCVVLTLALALSWLRALASPRPNWSAAALVGLVAAVLALTQPGEAPLAALFGLALVPVASLRRVLAVGLCALPFAAAAMAPWWLRNWLVFGAFVPLTSAAAISLWVGNNPDATGNWMPTPASLRGLPELEYARAAGHLAVAWIAAEPLAFARLTVTKFLRACGVAQFGIVRLAAATPAPAAGLTALLFPLSQGAHLLLLAGSSAAAFARRAVPPALLLLLVAGWAQIALFGVWFEFGERHRDYLTPLLLLLIASAQAAASSSHRRVTSSPEATPSATSTVPVHS